MDCIHGCSGGYIYGSSLQHTVTLFFSFLMRKQKRIKRKRKKERRGDGLLCRVGNIGHSFVPS